MNAQVRKSFWQLLCLSIGAFGIQYAWAVQYSQMSPFLESLGSVAWLTALIWCAGPITGTLTQPIVGALSDRTWTKLGSRKPFLLLGMIACVLCMIAMPNSPNLLTAALILWVWDTSINMCQGPIRWLAYDVVETAQQPLAFALISLMLGLGAFVAFYLGWQVPNMHFLFYIGAAAMVVTMGWTMFSTPEERPAHLAESELKKLPKLNLANIAKETWHGMRTMDAEAQKLCWANGFTWFGAQCMFVFFPLFVLHNLYGTHQSGTPLYTQAMQTVSLAWMVYYVVCFVFSPIAGKLCNILPMKTIHTFGLLCMAGALFYMYGATTPAQAVIGMGIAGMGWATTLSIPFAWAAQYTPEGKGGLHLAVFNTYIAFFSFIASLLVGIVVTKTGNDASALLLAGGIVTLSIIILQGVKERGTLPDRSAVPA